MFWSIFMQCALLIAAVVCAGGAIDWLGRRRPGR